MIALLSHLYFVLQTTEEQCSEHGNRSHQLGVQITIWDNNFVSHLIF